MNILYETLLGSLSLLIIFFFILFYSKKYPTIKNFLFTAFFVRASLVILEQFGFIILPDGNLVNSDANFFETTARNLSTRQGIFVVQDFLRQDSLLISRIISIFYTIFGESSMMAKSISVALGTASVYIIHRICIKIWNTKFAFRAAWLAALFPSLILYSAITLREVYVVFFLLISLIGIVNFIKKKSFFSFFQILISFYILSFFHGPAILGGFVFLIYLIIPIIKEQFIKLKNMRLNIFSIILIIILAVPIALFMSNNIKIPYIGHFVEITNLNYLISKANIGFNGTASYPSWLVIENNFEIFLKILGKILYFLYSPFVWDIKSSFHLIGFLDGVFYLVLTIYMIKNFGDIWKNPITRIFFLMFVCYLIVYGLGIGNFGTALRHRSKFIVILIILAVPKIKKVIFSVKKKYI